MCIVTFDLRRENRRHDNCTCTVEYISGGQKQNVHTKAISPFTEADRRRIEELTARKGTAPLAADEAKDIEQRVRGELAGRSGGELTGGENGGINKENIIVGRSLGAASKNYPIKLPDGNHGKVLEGTEITDIVVFAGKGTSHPLRVSKQLEEMYHIPADEWEKVRGTAYIRVGNQNKKAELHWYEAEGERVEMKVKRYY